jgi:hypothetical protein
MPCLKKLLRQQMQAFIMDNNDSGVGLSYDLAWLTQAQLGN